MIASIIDSYVKKADEFQITHGYQPLDSLFFVKEGSFCCSFGQEEATVSRGQLAIFDRRSCMDRRVLEPLTFLYIKFSPKSEGLFSVKSRVFFELGERELYDLARLESLSAERTRLSFELRNHYLNDLLISLLCSQNENEGAVSVAAIPSALDAPISYMKKNLSKRLSVRDIAEACSMSQSSLENKFCDLIGSSVYDHLIFLRMELAKRLLTETSLPISDISARCGYENQFYFSNAFKKQTHMTPTEYRRGNIV